jgi:CheY-like chemotaxis protein/signal transduction histidine kinase
MFRKLENYFSISYYLGLGLLLAFFLFGQVYTYYLSSQLKAYPELINVAGMHRMLSQKIVKNVLLISNSKDQDAKERYTAELKQTIESLERANMELRGRKTTFEDRLPKTSPKINEMLVEIEPLLQVLLTAPSQIDASGDSSKEKNLDNQKFIDEILRVESLFLAKIQAVVVEYVREAQVQEDQLQRFEIYFFLGYVAFALIILFLVFKPTSNYLKNRLNSIKQLVDSQAQMLDKYKNSEKIHGDMMLVLSHELRTPVNKISGITTLLKATSLDVNQKEYIGNIVQSVDSLSWLLNDILALSQLELGRMSLELTSFDLRGMLENCIDTFYSKAEEKDIGVIVSYDPDLSRYYIGDPKRIKQVISSLLSYALDNSLVNQMFVSLELIENDSYKSTIEVRITDSELDLTEMETDEEIDTEDIFRLKVSEDLVELMNGELKVLKGTANEVYCSFKITMPLDQDFTVNNIFYPTNKELAKTLKGSSTLLITTNEKYKSTIHFALSSVGGSIKCVSLKQSLFLALEEMEKDRQYDVIIIEANENNLTEVVDIVKEIKENPVYSQIHLILFSDSSASISLGNKIKSSFDEQINKPLKISQLFDCLEKVLEKEDQKTTNQPVIQNLYKSMNILVAEDNLVNQQVALLMLNKLGVNVDLARNGKEAVEMAIRNNYKLIFMDCLMPEMNGFVAAQKIRSLSDPAKRDVVIVAMTANTTSDYKIQCSAVGMNDFIGKPVKIEDFERVFKNYRANKYQKKLYEDDSILDFDVLKSLDSLSDESGLDEVLGIYLDTSFQEIKNLNQAVLKGDKDEIKQISYRLKSSCEDVGAKRISKLCGQLLALGQLNSINKTINLMEEINSEYQNVKKEISVILNK